MILHSHQDTVGEFLAQVWNHGGESLIHRGRIPPGQPQRYDTRPTGA